MVNFSISSSESQSIRHTSSSKRIRVAYGNTVAGPVPCASAPFAVAFVQQRLVCSSVCQGCQTLVHISRHASLLRVEALVNCCCYSLLLRPSAPMQSPHHPGQVCWQVPGGSSQSVMANHVRTKSQDGPNCAGRPNDSSARPIGSMHGVSLFTQHSSPKLLFPPCIRPSGAYTTQYSSV